MGGEGGWVLWAVLASSRLSSSLVHSALGWAWAFGTDYGQLLNQVEPASFPVYMFCKKAAIAGAHVGESQHLNGLGQ